MDRKWYEKPLRIAALQCNYEEGRTLDVVDKWADAGFNAEQLFHPMAESYTAVYKSETHRGLLVKYLAKARRRGLRVWLAAVCRVLVIKGGGGFCRRVPGTTWATRYSAPCSFSRI